MKKNSGITLIALIITINVMLILVAVTINMAINGGLFTQAGKATGDTKNALNAEQELANGKIKIGDKVYNSIDDYLAEIESSEQGEIHNWTRAGDTFKCLHCNTTYNLGERFGYKPKAKTSTTIQLSKLGMSENDIDDKFLNENGDIIAKQIETGWIVLGIEDQDNNGIFETLLITTDAPVEINSVNGEEKLLPAAGTAVYMNLPGELNRICKELYSNNEYGIARSMKIEDVNNVLNYTPKGGLFCDEMEDESVWKTTGSFTTPLKNLNSTWNTVKSNGTYTPEGLDTEATLENYKLDGYFYWTNNSERTEVQGPVDNIATTITEAEGNIIWGSSASGFEYWLASRGTLVNYGVACFGAGYAGYGEVYSCYDLFYSDGESYDASCALRPVVSIKSKIVGTEDIHEGIYYGKMYRDGEENNSDYYIFREDGTYVKMNYYENGEWSGAITGHGGVTGYYKINGNEISTTTALYGGWGDGSFVIKNGGKTIKQGYTSYNLCENLPRNVKYNTEYKGLVKYDNGNWVDYTLVFFSDMSCRLNIQDSWGLNLTTDFKMNPEKSNPAVLHNGADSSSGDNHYLLVYSSDGKTVKIANGNDIIELTAKGESNWVDNTGGIEKVVYDMKEVPQNYTTVDLTTMLALDLGFTAGKEEYIIPTAYKKNGNWFVITGEVFGFRICQNLKSITIPGTMNTIGNEAFLNCKALETVNIQNGVTTIDGQPFVGCSSLKCINIPASMTRFSSDAFSGCTALQSIIYNGTVEQWNAITKGASWNNNVPSTTVVTCNNGTVKLQ